MVTKNSIIDFFVKNKILLFLVFAGIFYRAYPHLFIIPRWIIEEDTCGFSVIELIKTGSTVRVGYQPILQQYLMYYFYLLTHINTTILLQYVNPVIGGLTAIPLYYCFRKLLPNKESLIATALWTFNENVIYRSSTFNSTETFGLFMAICALYSYLSFSNVFKKYGIFLLFITISIFSHLLPAVIMICVVSLDIFIKGDKTNKVVIFLFVFLTVVFLYSPLNPHMVMMYSINPTSLLSRFNILNIFFYSLSELILGVSLFFGAICIGIISFLSIIFYRKETKTIMYIYLLGCLGLFISSWMFYSNYLIGPTRVIFYFILPFSYFASILIGKLKNPLALFATCSLVIIMILTSLNGISVMLYTNNVMSIDEYVFLENSPTIHSLNSYSDWWTDMPFRASLLIANTNASPTSLPNLPHLINTTSARLKINATISTIITETFTNGTVTTRIIPPTYKYVLLSPRMERNAFFFMYTNSRTIQINYPVVDIWKDMPDWKLIEEYKNIKLYKWCGDVL